nr:GTP cyclohydrolase II [Pelistega sp. MC2]
MLPKIRNSTILPITRGKESTAVLYSFSNLSDGNEHFALVFKRHDGITPKQTLVRIHSECITGDVFGSKKCDCGKQLTEALELLGKYGGVLVYLRQEGRGIGLYNKIDAYVLQESGFDTFEANNYLGFPEDSRDYKVAAEILQVLGVKEVNLLTNNPIKVSTVERYGICVSKVTHTRKFLCKENKKYIETKINKTGHFFDNV